AWEVDDDHAHALADGGGERFVVPIAGLEPLLVDVQLLVQQWLELGLQSPLELIDEALDQLVLPVTVADEAGVLEGHVKTHLPAVDAAPQRRPRLPRHQDIAAARPEPSASAPTKRH